MGKRTEVRKDLRQRQWTKKEILEYLKRRASLLGHTPTVSDLNLDREGPSKVQIEKLFFSYDEAISKAGLEPLPRPWSQWGDDELVDLLKDWYDEHPNAQLTYSLLLHNPDLPSPELIRQRFGNIEGWFKIAGLDYEKPKSPWRRWTQTA